MIWPFFPIFYVAPQNFNCLKIMRMIYDVKWLFHSYNLEELHQKYGKKVKW